MGTAGLNPMIWEVVGQALIGETLPHPTAQEFDSTAWAQELSVAGWTTERIRLHALETLSAEKPWPHPIDPTLVRELGAARFYAALAEFRKLLGVWVLEVKPPSTRTALDQDELRLMVDVPPHHGS